MLFSFTQKLNFRTLWIFFWIFLIFIKVIYSYNFYWPFPHILHIFAATEHVALSLLGLFEDIGPHSHKARIPQQRRRSTYEAFCKSKRNIENWRGLWTWMDNCNTLHKLTVPLQTFIHVGKCSLLSFYSYLPYQITICKIQGYLINITQGVHKNDKSFHRQTAERKVRSHYTLFFIFFYECPNIISSQIIKI